jgi:hypothetical protein
VFNHIGGHSALLKTFCAHGIKLQAKVIYLWSKLEDAASIEWMLTNLKPRHLLPLASERVEEAWVIIDRLSSGWQLKEPELSQLNMARNDRLKAP